MQLSKCLVTLSTDSKLYPGSAVVLSPALAMQPVEAALTEEIFALVTEKHCLFLGLVGALNAAHQLSNLLSLSSLGAIELPNQVTIPDHEVLEVLDIFDCSLFLHDRGVVTKRLLQDVHQVWLSLDVDFQNPRQLYNILNGLHRRVLTCGLEFC
jgi:hypothetical protein